MLASMNGGYFAGQRASNKEAAMIHQHTWSSRVPQDRQQPIAPRAEDMLVPTQMTVDALARRCAAESERFYRGQTHDTRFAYELFRRALVERDEQAWEYLYRQYSTLVERWVRRSGAFTSTGETGEFFVGAAFTRFWRAITPQRFESFSTLAALLHYLQLCASCVVIDSVRAQSWAEVLPEEVLTASHTPQESPDEQALARVDRLEFWGQIDRLMNSEAERVMIFNSFVLGMTPSEIHAQRPDLFPSVNDVYNIKRNVLGRLGRNAEFKRAFGG
jgi:DNA-directed RNA polymerase specialized sigma24 family protein